MDAVVARRPDRRWMGSVDGDASGDDSRPMPADLVAPTVASVPPPTRRSVEGHEGLTLAVQERGIGAGPTVVLVHGYPDDHAVWDLVAEQLAADHHVVTYDVRGAGDSGVPANRVGYRLEALIGDLVAVVDAVSPHVPVHVAAHDWGSIQAWSAMVDRSASHRPDGGVRLASFTSMSGPGLEHVANWMQARRKPGAGRWGQAARQAASSWYIYAFHTPLAPLAWHHGLAKRWPEVLRRTEDVIIDDRWPGPRLADDAARGIGLYRANMFQTASRPRAVSTDVPVQLIVPADDPFVSPRLLDGIDEIAPDLTRRDVSGGHWLPRSQPEAVAGWIADHIAAVHVRSTVSPPSTAMTPTAAADHLA